MRAFARSGTGQQFAQACAQHALLAGLAAFVYALLFTIRHSAHLKSSYAQSWLRSTPVPPSSYRVAIAARLAVSAAATLIPAVASMAVLLASSGHAADAPSVLGWLAGSFCVGTVAGACWRVPEHEREQAESRYVLSLRPRAAGPSLEGLARWPIAKALAWHRPEHARVLFIVAALSVPAGTSALLGMAILMIWSLGSYLAAVARAVPAVAREAASWLRPTMVPFGAFAWAILRRALIHQLIGTSVLCAILVAAGLRMSDAVYIGALWLTLSAMIGTIGLRQSFLALPSISRTLVSIGLALAAESRARGAGCVIASIVTLAHCGVWRRVRA
jgi:hypothetical protein